MEHEPVERPRLRRVLQRITPPYWIAIALGLILGLTQNYWAAY